MEVAEGPDIQPNNTNDTFSILNKLIVIDDNHIETTVTNPIVENLSSEPTKSVDNDIERIGFASSIVDEHDVDDDGDGDGENNDDLEDGEIETDDDDEPVITAVIPAEKCKDSIKGGSIQKTMMMMTTTPTKQHKSSMIVDSNEAIVSSISAGNDALKFDKEILPMSSAKKNKFRRMEIMDDDWAGNIESAIAAALKKDGIEPPMPKLDKRPIDHFDKSDTIDDVKRTRKRKKREDKDKAKKRMKHHDTEHHSVKLNTDEIDEDEMVCVRGGSPPPTMNTGGGPMHHLPGHRHRRSPSPHSGIYNDSEDSYQSSYDSYDSAENRKMNYEERRQLRRNKDRRNRAGGGGAGGGGQTPGSGGRGGGGNSGKRRNRHDSDGDDCPRSHDARAPRKLELCKFYLMDCCAKKDKCSYMHADFPCKYYYLGMDCVYKSECKFSHGDPLTEQLKNILLKHIETAPKEILGSFRRISRENATNLLLTTHARLCAEKGIENTSALPAFTPRQSRSPSVNRGGGGGNNSMSQSFARKSRSPPDNRGGNPFASAAPPPLPPSNDDEENWDNEDWEKPTNSNSSPISNSNSAMNKSVAEKTRKSRWQDFMSAQSGAGGSCQSSDILSLKNLKGVITPEQIKRLENIGIENLEQISQLTVAQLNSVGLTIGQINEIQLNAMNIEKLGLITSQNSPVAPATSPITSSQNNANNSSHSAKFYNDDSQSVQDVDMRYLVVAAVQASGTTSSQSMLTASQMSESSTVSTSMGGHASQQLHEIDIASPEPISNSGKSSTTTTMDFSQYLKDSNVKDADDTNFNDLLKEDKEDDDALNEDEPELLIDESRCAGSDDETEANSEDTYSLSTGQVSSKVYTTKGEDDDDWDDDNVMPTASSAIKQTNATSSSSNARDNDDWQEEDDATASWQPNSNNRSHQNKSNDWQDDNNGAARGGNNRWKNKNKTDSWQDKSSKNDAWTDKGRNESWQDKSRNDSWSDRGRNEPWKEKNKNESWQAKGRNDTWQQQKSDAWQENRDSWQPKDSSPDFYVAGDAEHGDNYGSAGNSSRRDDQFGNRKQSRSDPRKNFGAAYDSKESAYESGASATTGQYRDPRLGGSNSIGFSRTLSSSSQQKSNVDNYDGDWDAEEDHKSSQAESSAKHEHTSSSAMHQDVIPIVIREPSPPPKYQRASIYDGSTIGNGDDDDDNSRGDDDDGREYAGDRDMRMPTFLESGDIDLRLPFKPVMTNYTPATEIDGSIASHSPIPYKVYEVSIPKPDYSEIRRTMTVTDKTLDPRLRRIFCLKEPIVDQYGSDNEMLRSPPHTTASMLLGSLPKPSEPVDKVGPNLVIGGPRMDPRRRKDNIDMLNPISMLAKQSGLGASSSTTGLGQNVDIRMLLQKSMWYKNLNSKYKIMVNQQLALVSTELKKFHQDNNPDKVFDMKFLATNQYLQQVLTNLGIFIDGNGQILQLDGENDDPMMSGSPGGPPGMMLPGMMMEGVPPMSMAMDFMRPPQPGGGGMPPMNSRFMGPAGGMLNTFGSRFSGEIRPGLLGVSPPINPFNPFDTNSPTNQFAGGLYGGPNGVDDYGGDQHHQGGGGGNPFDQGVGNDAGGKFYGGMDRSQGTGGGGHRGGNRNFRQGNPRNNTNDRWSAGGGGGPGNQGSGRNNQGRNRHYDNRGGGGGGGGGDRDAGGRRGDKQNNQQQQQQQPPPPQQTEQDEEEETWD